MVVEAATSEGRFPAQVVLRWALQQGQVSAHNHAAIWLNYTTLYVARHCCDLGNWMSTLFCRYLRGTLWC